MIYILKLFFCTFIPLVIVYLAFTDDMQDFLFNKLKGVRDIFINNQTENNKQKNNSILIFIYFIIVVVQQFLFFGYETLEKYEVLCIYVLIIIGLSIWAYLFSIFKKLSKNNKVILIILGGYCISIYMTAVSSSSLKNDNLKILLNFLYLAMPTFVIFELSKSKKRNIFTVIRVLKQRLEKKNDKNL